VGIVGSLTGTASFYSMHILFNCDLWEISDLVISLAFSSTLAALGMLQPQVIGVTKTVIA